MKSGPWSLRLMQKCATAPGKLIRDPTAPFHKKPIMDWFSWGSPKIHWLIIFFPIEKCAILGYGMTYWKTTNVMGNTLVSGKIHGWTECRAARHLRLRHHGYENFGKQSDPAAASPQSLWWHNIKYSIWQDIRFCVCMDGRMDWRTDGRIDI